MLARLPFMNIAVGFRAVNEGYSQSYAATKVLVMSKAMKRQLNALTRTANGRLR